MKKVAFVLGAGASQPFGFPLGSELIRNIIEGIKGNDFNSIYSSFHNYENRDQILDYERYKKSASQYEDKEELFLQERAERSDKPFRLSLYLMKPRWVLISPLPEFPARRRKKLRLYGDCLRGGEAR